MAEMERFELSRRLTRPTPLAGAPLRPLEYISVYLRERPFAELTQYIIHHSRVFVKYFLKKEWKIIRRDGTFFDGRSERAEPVGSRGRAGQDSLGSMASRAMRAASREMVQCSS